MKRVFSEKGFDRLDTLSARHERLQDLYKQGFLTQNDVKKYKATLKPLQEIMEKIIFSYEMMLSSYDAGKVLQQYDNQLKVMDGTLTSMEIHLMVSSPKKVMGSKTDEGR